MSWLEFISKISETMAWPAAVALIAFWLKDKIATLLLRLTSIKYKEFAAQFAEATKEIINEKTSAEERKEWKKQQVIHETPHYKLYSNGVLVEKLTLKILPNTSARQVTFPISFPNEVLSVQQSGEIEASISGLSVTGCNLSFSPSPKERELNLTISGI